MSVVSCKPRQVPQPRLNYSRFPKQPRGENRETEKREKKFFPSSIPAGKQLSVCSMRSDQHQAQSQPVFSGRLLVVIKWDITPLQILHVSPDGSFQPWILQVPYKISACFGFAFPRCFFFPRRTALGGVYLAGRPPSCCTCLESLCLLFSSSTPRNLTKDKTEAACGRHADGDLWQNLASGPSYQITYGGDFLCLQQKFDATLTALGAELWRRLREEITTSGPYIKTSI